MSVRVSYEVPRGCGRRKVGGLYLVTDGLPMACGRFPIPMEFCPTCGAGIRPARGWTWVEDGDLLVATTAPACDLLQRSASDCLTCPMDPPTSLGRCGLLWIGEKFYPTPGAFLDEAARMGVSRRLPANQVPRGFEAGKTWIFLAHRKAIWKGTDDKAQPLYAPGAFMLWRPSRIECVVPEGITDEEVEALRKRGIEPVIVRGVESPLGLDEEETDDDV